MLQCGLSAIADLHVNFNHVYSGKLSLTHNVQVRKLCISRCKVYYSRSPVIKFVNFIPMCVISTTCNMS